MTTTKDFYQRRQDPSVGRVVASKTPLESHLGQSAADLACHSPRKPGVWVQHWGISIHGERRPQQWRWLFASDIILSPWKPHDCSKLTKLWWSSRTSFVSLADHNWLPVKKKTPKLRGVEKTRIKKLKKLQYPRKWCPKLGPHPILNHGLSCATWVPNLGALGRSLPLLGWSLKPPKLEVTEAKKLQGNLGGKCWEFFRNTPLNS